MDVFRLNGLDALARLLETDERDRPGLILVASATSLLALDLRKEFERMALRMPQFVFYAFDTDDYSDPDQDRALTRLLEDWRIQPPAQILLPSNRPPVALHGLKSEDIRTALKDLY